MDPSPPPTAAIDEGALTGVKAAGAPDALSEDIAWHRGALGCFRNDTQTYRDSIMPRFRDSMAFVVWEFGSEEDLHVRWNGEYRQRYQVPMHRKERRFETPQQEHLVALGGHHDLNSTEDHDLSPSVGHRFTRDKFESVLGSVQATVARLHFSDKRPIPVRFAATAYPRPQQQRDQPPPVLHANQVSGHRILALHELGSAVPSHHGRQLSTAFQALKDAHGNGKTIVEDERGYATVVAGDGQVVTTAPAGEPSRLGGVDRWSA